MMLVIIATNAMLSTEQFPRANDDWGELNAAQCTWTRWNTTYRAAAKMAAIKNKSSIGKYQFVSTHTATQ